jgi:hypothetical protein
MVMTLQARLCPVRFRFAWLCVVMSLQDVLLHVWPGQSRLRQVRTL